MATKKRPRDPDDCWGIGSLCAAQCGNCLQCIHHRVNVAAHQKRERERKQRKRQKERGEEPAPAPAPAPARREPRPDLTRKNNPPTRAFDPENPSYLDQRAPASFEIGTAPSAGTGRGDAAAAAWMFRRVGSRRRRGCRVDVS